ncbi:hypothetical protein [Ectobacillus funiculus]|uniref:Uncharacterized protein n=1 Tax=Ectobacillus funiculus TaxID=137993 RepID=A0ABV5WGC5_9BACI
MKDFTVSLKFVSGECKHLTIQAESKQLVMDRFVDNSNRWYAHEDELLNLDNVVSVKVQVNEVQEIEENGSDDIVYF